MDQPWKVVGEVDVLGDVAIDFVAVVAVSHDGSGDGGDVGLQSLHHVAQVIPHCLQGTTHGARRVEGEDNLHRTVRRHEGHVGLFPLMNKIAKQKLNERKGFNIAPQTSNELQGTQPGTE